MSFLQPWLLAALPIAALPVIIHLINQRRFQTVEWAAMRFLLEANRMSRGYARIRQWLILLFRALAIAGLVLMVSRPLASGWIGLTGGGRADTTLILLDRSPSMQQIGAGTAHSKFETGVEQLVRTLSTVGSARWVLIDSVTCAPQELQSPAALAHSPSAQPTSASADLPAMLQAAHDYIQANRTGETEIWICSDLRANDWDAESGRWKSLRESFGQFQQSVRFHLLAYPAAAPGNVAVRMTAVERRPTSDGAVLYLSLRLARDGGEGKLRVPLQVEIEGARSELNVEMEGRELEIRNHPIPLARDRVIGWGRVSIPADLNPADNEFYFVFDEPPPRRTILVAEAPEAVRPLQLAAEISPDPTIELSTEMIAPDQLASVRWGEAALVVWQAPLPALGDADLVRQFVERGGQAVFFPPRSPGDAEFYGTRWTGWAAPPEPVRTETWRGDHDLLARTQSGAALPVGELVVRRYCGLSGEVTSLATLPGGAPLLARAPTDRGGVYFFATTASAGDSSLASDGVALYVAIQRALAAGAAELGITRHLTAGEDFPSAAGSWQQLAGLDEALSTEYPFHAGVYTAANGMVAVNRAAAEDQAAVLSDRRVADLFRGLDFARVDDQAGNVASLAREAWRMFLAAMLVAMIAEAALCIPRPPRTAGVVR